MKHTRSRLSRGLVETLTPWYGRKRFEKGVRKILWSRRGRRDDRGGQDDVRDTVKRKSEPGPHKGTERNRRGKDTLEDVSQRDAGSGLGIEVHIREKTL